MLQNERSVWIVPTSRYKMMCMIPDTMYSQTVALGVSLLSRYPYLRIYEWYPLSAKSHRCQKTVDVKFFIMGPL